jgi:hypothetical protein
LAVEGFYIEGLSGNFILIFMCRMLPETQIVCYKSSQI